jgi:hypothetical protein
MRSIAVVKANSRAERSGVVPMPGVAILSFPGLDLASATSSAIVLMVDDACKKNTCGDAARFEMGMRSLYGSYGILEYRVGLTTKLELTMSHV